MINNDKSVDPEHELIFLRELALRMKVGYSFVRAMKKAGLPLHGGKISVVMAREWLQSAPPFKVFETLNRKPRGQKN